MRPRAECPSTRARSTIAPGVARCRGGRSPTTRAYPPRARRRGANAAARSSSTVWNLEFLTAVKHRVHNTYPQPALVAARPCPLLSAVGSVRLHVPDLTSRRWSGHARSDGRIDMSDV